MTALKIKVGGVWVYHPAKPGTRGAAELIAHARKNGYEFRWVAFVPAGHHVQETAPMPGRN